MTQTTTEATGLEGLTNDDLVASVDALRAQLHPLEAELERRAIAQRVAATIVALRGRPVVERARWIRPPGAGSFHLFRREHGAAGRVVSLCERYVDPPAPTIERRRRGAVVSEVLHGLQIPEASRCARCARYAGGVRLGDLVGQLAEVVRLTEPAAGDADAAGGGTSSTSPGDGPPGARDGASAGDEPVLVVPAASRGGEDVGRHDARASVPVDETPAAGEETPGWGAAGASEVDAQPDQPEPVPSAAGTHPKTAPRAVVGGA